MTTKLAGILVIFAGIFTASCNGLSIPGTKSSSSSNKSSATETAAKPSGNAQEDVKNAFIALSKVPCFRAHLDNYSKGMTQIEYVAPGRFHALGNPDAPGQSSGQEMIVIDRDTYFKIGGNWQKAPPGSGLGELIHQLGKPDVNEEMQKYLQITYAGTDSIDGAQMQVYEFRKKETDALEISGRMWIGATDGLPHKIETQSPKANNVKRTVRYEYPDDIKIEPPI